MEINYTAEETISQFHASKAFVRGLRGPIGCLAGDTLVITSKGLVPMQDITPLMRVLSWSENKGRFLFASCSGSFLKGEDFLYRVSTPHGEFASAGHHLVFCGDGKYRRVDTLSQGQILFQYSENPLHSICEIFRLWFSLNAFHWSGKYANCLDDYVGVNHQDDQQLHSLLNTFQFCFPSLNDVQVCGHDYDSHAFLHGDGREGLKQENIRPSRLCGLIYKMGFSSQGEPRNMGEVNFACPGFDVHSGQRHLLFELFHCLKRLHLTFLSLVRLCSSYICSYTKRVTKIIFIKQEKVKRKYYDIQVSNTNNYITIDGTIHHNSGKSVGCASEVMKNAIQQRIHKGVRKSRWGIIRETYPELKSTTIKTWLEWFGDFTRMVYGSPIMGYVNILLPDKTIIDLELVFLALERPKDIKKLKSLELTGAWINEAVEVAYPIISMATGRINRFPAKRDGGSNWSGLIADTNSCDVDNWWYKMSEEERPENWEFFDQPAALLKTPGGYIPNPLAENIDNLSGGYEYYLNQLPGKPKEWVKVFILNQFGSTDPGNLVYGDYSISNHTDKIFNPDLKHIVWTHDFNFTPMSSAILQRDEKDDIYVVDEIVLKSAVARQSALEFVERYKDYTDCVVIIYGDASGHIGEKHGHASDYIEIRGILTRAGFTVKMKVPRSNPAIKDGQNSLRARIIDATGKISLFVNPKKCKYVDKGLLTLQLKKGSTFQEEDTEYQHITTALRYFTNVEYPIRSKNRVSTTGW